jgi:hypothetical protein
LVPIVACEFLLTAFDHQLFEPIVSTTVLDEQEGRAWRSSRREEMSSLR